ncbi:TPA: helix-turn-helix domain-containing protein [Salmonella enterica subsp. enterica serovar Veneziana]|nr:helix-turn-helix domain-containing protein [Salmonella enterica subsp. enterica serovar Veneziana]
MLGTDHDPKSINSLLLCAQVALLSGTVSSIDVINVLDVAQDLISLTLNNSDSNEISTTILNKTQPAPLYAPYDGGLLLGDRIQLARENLGLTEADVARTLGIYSDHISGWECGTTELPANMVIPLANALKCDPLWLLTGEITPQASSDNVAQQHHRASQQAGGVSREVLQQ